MPVWEKFGGKRKPIRNAFWETQGTHQWCFCFVLFCFVLFCFVLFCFVFERKNDQGRGWGRGRERIPSRLHTWSRAQSYEIVTWPKISSWIVNQRNHPGAPVLGVFDYGKNIQKERLWVQNYSDVLLINVCWVRLFEEFLKHGVKFVKLTTDICKSVW